MYSDILQWVEIDTAALRHNLDLFRSVVPSKTRLMLVVKANAYGHGLEQVTRLAAALPVDVLGVHALDEAIRVRGAGWRGPVYVLGYVAEARLAEAVHYDLDLTVVDFRMLEAVDRVGREVGKRIRCHLKLETGTHRQGMGEAEFRRCLELVERGDPSDGGVADVGVGSGTDGGVADVGVGSGRGEGGGAILAGLSTHFANIEDTTDQGFARRQLESFLELTAPVAKRHPEIVRHAACSAAALTLPETAFDLVRVGIGAYGYWPSRETRVSFRELQGEGTLRPVLSWKARLGQIREIPAGAYVGYGCTERVARPTRMAVLPIGYSDGFDRGLSRIGHVLVHGQRARVLGRVCMNIIMVDVTDVGEVKPEDEAVLLGVSGSESINANDLAALLQTLSYEILARISPTLPRFVVG